MASRIPHLLEPYLAVPPASAHVLLTNVLGASSNWAILRYLYTYLQKKDADISAGPEDGTGAGAADIKVVLVSFMRDFTFWKESAGRLGLDLESLCRTERLVFVDGLTSLFAPPSPEAAPAKGIRTLKSAKLDDVRRELLAAVSEASAAGGSASSKTILIVDQPDVLLAASSDLPPEPPNEEATFGLALRNLLLDVQEKVYSSIVTAAADEPLVASQHTGLEKEHAALLLSLAHNAEMVLSLRLLDTGSASDVSGVMRITRGGADHEGERDVEEAELLYYVGGDGSVKVFHRGQG